MPAIISTPPNMVFELYQALERNGDREEIARNDAYSVVIFISREFDSPEFVVELDNDPIYSESINDDEREIPPEVWCEERATKLFTLCLSYTVFELLEDGPSYGDEEYEPVYSNDDETSELEDMMYDREEELDDHLEGLLDIVTRYSGRCLSSKEERNIIDDSKDKLLEYLARKYQINIWRPMYLRDENGEVFMEEYPYGHLIFDEKVDDIFK